MSSDLRSAWTVFAVTAPRAVRSGLLWGVVFSVSIAETGIEYATAYPTPKDRADLAAAWANNVGLTALLGPARGVDTVAGYSAWHAMGVLGIFGAIWGLLLATRLTRAEEDAGRWEMLLAGQTNRRRAAMQALAGIAVGLMVLWAVTAAATIAVGSRHDVNYSVTGSLFFATTLVAGAVQFAAVGFLAGQVASSRRQANTIGGAVLVAAYLVRMVADSGAGVEWLRWASPLGWPEHLRPFTDPNPAGFLPIVAFATLCAIAALRIAGRRDLGAGVGPARATTSSHTRLLTGQFGLTLRLIRPLLVAWLAAMAICGLMFGVAAEAGGNAGADSIQRAVGRFGGEYGGAAAYLGVVFMVGAGLVAFAAAGQISATRAEEADGYVDHLLVRPVARWRWLAGRAVTSAGLVAAVSVMAGLASWVGTASQHDTVPFDRLLLAGVNVAPPALFVLGAGLLVYGIRPRLASPIAYGLVAWSLLVQILASGLDLGRWLRDTSVLTHMAPAPAADPNWGAAAWLAGLGLALAVGGIAAFSRRDLVTA